MFTENKSKYVPWPPISCWETLWWLPWTSGSTRTRAPAGRSTSSTTGIKRMSRRTILGVGGVWVGAAGVKGRTARVGLMAFFQGIQLLCGSVLGSGTGCQVCPCTLTCTCTCIYYCTCTILSLGTLPGLPWPRPWRTTRRQSWRNLLTSR